MNYAPVHTRIDVANTQYRVLRAVEELRSALDATATIPDVTYYAERGDTDLVVWSYVVERMSTYVGVVEEIIDAVEQITPYDDFGPLDRPSHARDVHTARNARKGSAMQADPFAPTPVDAGVAAFGVSRSITPDNPFADVFAARGTFGHVAQ